MIIEEQKLNKPRQPHLHKANVGGSTVLNRDGLPNSDNWETPEWLYNKLNAELEEYKKRQSELGQSL